MKLLLALAFVMTPNIEISGGGADNFCSDLRQVVASARERVPFASLARAALPQFGFRVGCRIGTPAEAANAGGAEPAFICGGSYSTDEEMAAIGNIESRTAHCLPAAIHREGTDSRTRIFDYESNGVRVRIREYGASPRSELGHSTTLIVSRVP
jgi:hypothetical protein